MKVISKALLVSLAIGLLAFAGGCAEEGLPAGMSPGDVITKALLNPTEFNQALFEMKAKADLAGEVEGEQNSLNGDFDLSGSSNSDTGEMSVTMTLDAVMNEESVKANLEIRATQDGVFIKIGKIDLSDAEMQELVELFLEDFLGKWVKLTFMTAEELTESGYAEIDYKEGDPLPFKNIEYKGRVNILGLESYHFTAEVDEDLVLGMMQGADTAEAKEFFEAAEITGDVYVAVEEMVLTGFGGTMTMNDPEMNGTVEMSVMVNPTKSATVTTPDHEKEFTEEDMMGLMFGGAMMADPSVFDSSMMEFDESMMDEEGEMMSDEEFEAIMKEFETEVQ
ncbi:hypothetical protein ACFLZH_02330 [Patescibacteria group bacterium]